jgi:hypothetical protein
VSNSRRRKTEKVGNDNISAGVHFERCAPAFSVRLAKAGEIFAFLCYNYCVKLQTAAIWRSAKSPLLLSQKLFEFFRVCRTFEGGKPLYIVKGGFERYGLKRTV